MSAQRIPLESAYQSSGAPLSPRNIAKLRGPLCTRGTSVAPGSGAQYQMGSSYGLRVHAANVAHAANAINARACMAVVRLALRFMRAV